MTRLLYALIALVLTACSQASPNAEPRSSAAPADTVDPLAMLSPLRAETGPTENIIYSPLSTAQALGLVHLGSRGNTQAEIARFLGLPPGEAGDHRLRDLRLAARPDRESPVRLTIANAVFVSDDFSFRESYVADAGALYDAAATPLDFSDQPGRAAQTMNLWVDSATDGMIARVTDPASIRRDAAAYLINATVFHGEWRSVFQRTEQGRFLFADGRDVEFAIMIREGAFAQASINGWKAVRLPYADERFVMDVMLPERRQAKLPDIDARDLAVLAESLTAAEPGPVRIHLPRFQATVRQDLKPILEAAGLSLPFDRERADLSAMAAPGQSRLYIDQAFQIAKLEVFAAGTRAAAVTLVVPAPVSAPPPFAGGDFVVDHPFLFVIRDLESGAVLFFGRILSPEPLNEPAPGVRFGG